MKPTEAARIAGVSVDTVKRWLATYPEAFSPGATPPPGRQRVLNQHDIRVLAMIVTLREAGQTGEEVTESLNAARNNGWRDLPPLPAGAGESISTELAAGRAAEMVENAVLTRELQLVRQQLTEAVERADQLAHELDDLRAGKQTADDAQHALELELERARGDVKTLEARLAAYSIRGAAPASPLVLIAGAALVTLLIALVVVAVVLLAG